MDIDKDFFNSYIDIAYMNISLFCYYHLKKEENLDKTTFLFAFMDKVKKYIEGLAINDTVTQQPGQLLIDNGDNQGNASPVNDEDNEIKLNEEKVDIQVGIDSVNDTGINEEEDISPDGVSEEENISRENDTGVIEEEKDKSLDGVIVEQTNVKIDIEDNSSHDITEQDLNRIENYNVINRDEFSDLNIKLSNFIFIENFIKDTEEKIEIISKLYNHDNSKYQKQYINSLYNKIILYLIKIMRINKMYSNDVMNTLEQNAHDLKRDAYYVTSNNDLEPNDIIAKLIDLLDKIIDIFNKFTKWDKDNRIMLQNKNDRSLLQVDIGNNEIIKAIQLSYGNVIKVDEIENSEYKDKYGIVYTVDDMTKYDKVHSNIDIYGGKNNRNNVILKNLNEIMLYTNDELENFINKIRNE